VLPAAEFWLDIHRSYQSRARGGGDGDDVASTLGILDTLRDWEIDLDQRANKHRLCQRGKRSRGKPLFQSLKW